MARNILRGLIELFSRKKKKPTRRGIRRRGLIFFALRLFYRGLFLFVVVSVVLILPLRWLPPLTSSFMLQRYFQDVHGPKGREAEIHYQWVPYAAISPYMALAVVAGEDQKFPLHEGFDFEAIETALKDRIKGKPLRGASTISQQVVKNLYLWPGRNLLRKGLEAWLTLLMEILWPKQRILEVYMNIAEFGEDTFGVEAASRRFFNKTAAHLNRQEAALLAAVLPNPQEYQVEAPSAYVRKRQAWILRQMRQLGGPDYLQKR
jgi:monofunctional biosynthetic peptidoglycan transglycosylase